ncbi:MAG: class I SAM-dependent methyltransferase [Verrucomicrobia bacterium]|nr:class I SAM-dependent methyltransferase [Verrucomicrobiota bacterium]
MQHYKFHVKTDHPIAYESPDHLEPAGTKNDNFSNAALIHEIEESFGYQHLNMMDLGCAGGLFVHDFIKRGHFAVGLEGSNYNIKAKRAEWPALHEKNLFTCDICEDYSVLLETNGETTPYLCDLVTAWEVVEHIPPDKLGIFFEGIRKHLKIGGRFVAGISLCEGPPYHVSLFSIEDWKTKILNKLPGFVLKEYPYFNVGHPSFTSLYIMLERTA